MALGQTKTYLYSLEEYLEFERRAETKSEYLDGEIYQMSGESGKHADISMNLATIIGYRLRGSNCRGRVKDTKVKSGALIKRFGKGMISYPDLVVICGEPLYHDKHKDVVLNPKVIIEVLSDSTEDFDRGAKFIRYRNFNDSLTDYILVSQEEARIECFTRLENGEWLLRDYDGTDKTFQIEAINCKLDLAEVYERVEFEAVSEDMENGNL